MTVTCELCSAEVADLANVCPRCARKLRLDLHDAPSLDTELEVATAKLTRIGSGGGRSSEPRLPVNLDADTAGRQLKATLASWADMVADQRGIVPPLDGITPTSRWLLDHIEWLRHHTAGADAVTEIRDAIRAARTVIDRPRSKTYAGRCDQCGTSLFAHENATQAVCPVCVGPDHERQVYSVQERRDAMLAAMSVLCMAPPQAAYALSTLVHPIPANTIRQWSKRGKLHPAGVDEHGRNIYRLADIAKLMISSQQAS